eukprot:7075104-Prymnesium_polylepis.1
MEPHAASQGDAGAHAVLTTAAAPAAKPSLDCRKDDAERRRQLAEATAWAKANGKRGYSAAHRKDDGGNRLWPLAAEGSVINR